MEQPSSSIVLLPRRCRRSRTNVRTNCSDSASCKRISIFLVALSSSVTTADAFVPAATFNTRPIASHGYRAGRATVLSADRPASGGGGYPNFLDNNENGENNFVPDTIISSSSSPRSRSGHLPLDIPYAPASSSTGNSMGASSLGPSSSLSSRSSSPSSRPQRKSSALSATSSSIRYGPPLPVSPKESSSSTLLQKLTSISSIASLLCVLDCTILPLVTIALPLLGLASPQSAMAEMLHDLGHGVALYFVLPVGTLATVTGYANHRNWILSIPGMLGLMLIYVSNAGHVHLHTASVHGMAGGLNPLMILPHSWVHALNGMGWVHRVVNIVGCGLMLGGNYLSRTFGGVDGAGGGCALPGCRREDCEVDGRGGGVGGVDGETPFFRVERPLE